MTAYLAPAQVGGVAFLATPEPSQGTLPEVSSVLVTPVSGTVAGGALRQFAATVLGTGSPSQEVTWATTAGSITAGGLLTAPPTGAVIQTALVTATSVQDPTKSGTATVVVPAEVAPEPDPEIPDERNYAWLQAEVIDWLHRKDLTSKIPKFVTMAEARINRIVQARGMEIESTFSFAAGIASVRLPVAFDTPIAAWVSDGTERRKLTGALPELLPRDAQAGEPLFWAISGAYLALDCPVDRARSVTMRYRGLLRLSDASPNNSILTKYPDLYLYGSLMAAAMFINDQERLQVWSAMFDTAVKELNRNESRARAIAPLRTELAGLLGSRCGNFYTE